MAVRQIVLDTETTGLSPAHGHRIIEIGCYELLDRQVGNKHFHFYLNPEREIDEGALAVHGITSEFLADKPKFADIMADFVAYIKGCELIIHNAPFDVGFINAELRRHHHPVKDIADLCPITNSLLLARDKHPGQRNSLDALCKRYEIDNSGRELHGALLDAQLLADVYLRMTSGQASLLVEAEVQVESSAAEHAAPRVRRQTRLLPATEQELADHHAYLQFIQEKSGQCIALADVSLLQDAETDTSDV